MQWVNAFLSALRPVHMQPPMTQVYLRPAKLTEFLRSQSMPIRQEDRSRIVYLMFISSSALAWKHASDRGRGTPKFEARRE
jgi:hypothetical protein